DNIVNRSPWIYQQLNGKYGLKCNASGVSTATATSTATENGFNAGTSYTIQSVLDSSRYLDIPNPGNTSPVVADNKSNPPTPSQLWTFVSDGQSGFFYIQSQSGFFLSFGGAQGSSNIRLVSALEQGSSILPSELWKFVPNGTNALTGYIQS